MNPPILKCTRIWIIAGITDMGCGFNGLTSKVQNTLKDDPFSGHIFVFRGRSGKMVKILWADRDGLCLFAKRLERGRFVWPVTREAQSQLTLMVGDAVLKASDSPGRKALPATLPRDRQIISPAENECPVCNGKLKPLGESISEQLDIINTAFRVKCMRTTRR